MNNLIDNALTNPKIDSRFEMEAGVISQTMDNLYLSVYIDVGAWLGQLAEKVCRKAVYRGGIKVVLIEPVQEFLRECRNRTLPYDTIFINTAISAYNDGSFRVNQKDLSMSGFGSEGELIRVNSVAPNLLSSLVYYPSHAYLKIDAEGCDLEIVRGVADAGFGAIQFECSNQEQFEIGVGVLLDAGYQVPEFVPGHAFYSVICTRKHSKLIGFDPDKVYG